MSKITSLLLATTAEDVYIGKILLFKKNEELFKQHMRYRVPWFILDPITTSAILGEVFPYEIYYSEAEIQEFLPEMVNDIMGRKIIASMDTGELLRSKDTYIPTEKFDWDDI